MNPIRWTAALVMMLFTVAALPTGTAAEDAAASKVVVHLGHYTDDLHAASMGMSIARLLQKKGAQVTVFLDREGVRLVDSRGPDDLRWGAKSESVREIFAGFVAAGGKALVCPHCAAAAGITADVLVTGATIGDEDSVAALLLAADRVIDY